VLLQYGVDMTKGITDGATAASDAVGGHLGLLADAVRALGTEGLKTVLSIASAAASIIAIIVLSTLLSFYFLRDGEHLWQATLRRTRVDVRDRVNSAGQNAFEVLGGYMFGTAVVSFVGALSQLVIMLILGIPLALPIFVLSFFLCFIPYVGGFISTGAAFLLTVAVGSPVDIAVMAVWTLVFNLVTGNIVSPLVYGKTVHLHPAVVLVAIPAGSAVAGVLGMFLVVPALGVVAVTWRTVLAMMAARVASIAPVEGGGVGVPDDRGGEGASTLESGLGSESVLPAAPPA
jgi:predicted PurR-regulated permease PerM